ncbi:MAG: amino acid ABC transporter permease [Oscillospiraceae bacterium]|nr:amino acid ABC transporter permease [Oscillospiraceae bacterium]
MTEWFKELADRFYSNFIKDDRWQYITNGLWVTIQITVLAVLVGIVIGFLVAIIRSTHDKTGKLKIANFICRVYLTVIRGTPVVVQLLIIYYGIFASVNINKMIVAVIAFGINSGAYVAEIVRSGIMSIDKGQFEAGRSLGFNYAQTMIYIIIPQAFKNVLPALGNELIVLLKETSVSGYIAMEDLTKGGDIIRSRTYDAMMPLLAVAIIYLTVVVFLEFLVGKLERRLRNSDH